MTVTSQNIAEASDVINDQPVGFVEFARDAREEELALLLFGLREAIATEARNQKVSKAELARRLNVSRSRVTRVMDPGADVLASSIFDIGWALGCGWRFGLHSLARHTETSASLPNSNTKKSLVAGWIKPVSRAPSQLVQGWVPAASTV